MQSLKSSANGRATFHGVPGVVPQYDYRQVDVTPEIAHYWLTHNFENNRSVNTRAVRKYSEDMANGDWVLSPQPITFAPDGTLIDGQHRLHAVIRSGVTVTFIVAGKVPLHAASGIDTGGTRALHQVMKIMGVKNVSATEVAMVRMIAHMTGETVETPNQAAALLESKYGEDVDRIVSIVPGKLAIGKVQYRAALAFCRPADPDRIDLFAQQFADGAMLEHGNPILALRNAAFLEPSGRHAPRIRDRREEMFLKSCASVESYLDGTPITRMFCRPSAFVKFATRYRGLKKADMPNWDDYKHSVQDSRP